MIHYSLPKANAARPAPMPLELSTAALKSSSMLAPCRRMSSAVVLSSRHKRRFARMSNIESAAGPLPDPGGRPEVPLIRATVDEYRSAGAKQVAQDVSSLLATAAPSLHVKKGAYLWLTSEAWEPEPRVTVHLLTRNQPSSDQLFTL